MEISIHEAFEILLHKQQLYLDPSQIKDSEDVRSQDNGYFFGSISRNWPGILEPHESPIEKIFAEQIFKYLSEDAYFEKQVSVNTICGTFRLDFVAECAGRRIGIECDGKDYHDPYRDQWRDAMILDQGQISAIYRLKGKNIYWDIEDCLFALAAYEPQLFSERGLSNLKNLASDSAKSSVIDSVSNNFISTNDSLYFSSVNEFSYEAISRNCYNPVTYSTEFLKSLVDFARELGGGNLDEVKKQYEHRFSKMEVWKT